MTTRWEPGDRVAVEIDLGKGDVSTIDGVIVRVRPKHVAVGSADESGKPSILWVAFADKKVQLKRRSATK